MYTKTPLIFLIFGASGSGKSTLMQELEKMKQFVTVHTKGTDREDRQYDGDEILCKKEISSYEYDYIYSRYDHRYGIQRIQIDNSIQQGKHHFIICNDADTIEDIKRDYGVKVRVIFLRFDAPRESILAIQKSRKISDDEINLRVQKIQHLNQVFIDRSYLFDEVIINKFGAPIKKMLTQVNRIIAAEECCSHVLQSEGKMQTGLILMSMTVDDPLLEDTHAGIKCAAEHVGLIADRVDEISFTELISEKIMCSIRCAEYIIADLTFERPNVYYELGYAHAFDKKTILTAREGTELLFDVRNYQVIFYSSRAQLEERLKKRLLQFEHKTNYDI